MIIPQPLVSPKFTQQNNPSNPFIGVGAASCSAPTFADLDGDGDLDLLIGEQYGTLSYFKNTGSANAPIYTQQFGSNNPFNGVDVGSWSTPTFADIDGDGDLDAIIGERYSIKYYQNIGSAKAPVFMEQSGSNNPLNTIDAELFSSATFVDLDGDSDLDAVIGVYDGTLRYYKNTGSAVAPVYTKQTGNNNPFNGIDVGSYSSPAFADLDGDGDFDLVIGELYGSLSYYKNIGSSTAPAYTLQTGSSNPFDGLTVPYSSSPTFADIDGDGDLDAIVGEFYGSLQYFVNTPSIINRAPVAVNDVVSTNENTILNGNVLSANPANPDSDPDGNPLSVSEVNGNSANVGAVITLGNGKLKVNANGTFSFDPNGGYESLAQGATATETFTYTLSDGNGGSALATVTLTITGVNDAASITGNATGTVTEDTAATLTTSGILSVTDVDYGENKFNPNVISTQGNLGNLTINSTGVWNYSVDNNLVQSLGQGITKTETFIVSSFDGSASQNINITIAGINDVPIVTTPIAAQTLAAYSLLNFAIPAGTFTDVDAGDVLTYTATLANGSPLPSWLSFNPGTQSFQGIANSEDLGSLSIKVTATDTAGASVFNTFALNVVLPTTTTTNTINGTPLADILQGTASNDLINGLDGNDIIIGNAGDDTINGEGGNDVLRGGIGNDILNGGIGNDQLYGDDGNDILIGGDGIDTLRGGISNDILDGGTGNDLLFGDEGTDTLIGGSGDDNIQGGNGDDLLYGSAGNDYIYGDAGNDTLWGGTGTDLMWGGAGRDRFGLQSGQGADTVRDFSLVDDVFVLGAGLSYGSLTFSQSGANTLIKLGTETLATVFGVQSNLITSTHFV